MLRFIGPEQNPDPMKPTTSKVKNGLYFIIALSISLLIRSESLKAQSFNASQYIYGVDSLGRVYPVNIADGTKASALNLSTANTPLTNASRFNYPNGIGYSSSDSKFYYYWKSPSGGTSKGEFVSYNPSTKVYESLTNSTSTDPNAPTYLIKSGSVIMDGRYFCLDVNGRIYSYSNTTKKWTLIANKIVDAQGNDVSAIVSVYNTGDMAFDGLGNLWIIVSGKGSGNAPKIGLYMLKGPFNNTSPATFTAEAIIPTDQLTPDGSTAVGIAFDPNGDIYINTATNLYLFDPQSKSFTLKSSQGSFTNIQDLTSMSYPMNVMPVKWVGFNAEAGNKNQVLLTWEVTDQVDNKGFYVQYSKDQKNWDDVTFINSKSSGGNNEKYSYIYTGLISSENYFRLKQVDLDGKFSYSKIKSVRPAKQVNSVESNVIIYPNPVRDVLNITNIESSNYTAKIVDMSGRVIKSFVMRNGQNQIDVASLKSGIYLISMNDMNGKVNSAKMVKL
jgi:hypothetical protein